MRSFTSAMITLHYVFPFLEFISDFLPYQCDSARYINFCALDHIKMRIFSGINDDNALRSVYHAVAVFILVLHQTEYHILLNNSQESVFLLRMPNVTSNDPRLYYGIPYKDCRCSVVSTENCLTDKQFRVSRVLPLIFFVLQIYLAREVFSLSGDCVKIFINVLWIVSIFVFIGMVVIIYQYNYYYGYAVSMLCGNGYLLFGFVCYEVGLDGYRNRSSRNNNVMVNAH